MANAWIAPTPEDLQACLDTPSTIVETAAGPVEYAVRGQGPVVLCVHGGPGGYDQGLVLGEVFRRNGFQVLSVSRPGYLGTPLATGPSPTAQADALAALLDRLGMEAVRVVGASAGGPSTYLLAARHPDRVRALLEIDAVCRSYRPSCSDVTLKLSITPLGLKLTAFLAEYFPKTAISGLLASESSLKKKALKERVAHVMADPLKQATFHCIIHTFADRAEERHAGVLNDLAITAELGDLPLVGVRCPTLIIHGEADSDVTPDHARYAAGAIAGARLEWIGAGSHMGFWLADTAEDMQRLAVAWLRDVDREAAGMAG